MGLDVSHGAWQGGYMFFMRWRRQVAQHAGLPPLDFMEGFYSDLKGPNPAGSNPLWSVDYAMNGSALLDELNKALPIRWDVLLPSPLFVLLHHSDCEGDIAVEDLLPLAGSLETVLENVPESEETAEFRTLTRRFADGCREAAELGEPLEFY